MLAFEDMPPSDVRPWLLAAALCLCASCRTEAPGLNANDNDAGRDAHLDASPMCGNAVREGDEPCDDGNDRPWDGCDACQITELQVNSHTEAEQKDPAVAMAPDGRFVVVWTSEASSGTGQGDRDGSGTGVYAQRYDQLGHAVGAEFLVNSNTSQDQRAPAVAMAGDGRFVVVWVSENQDGSQTGIYGQRYAADGSLQAGEFRVNSHTANYQSLPAVAMADALAGGDPGDPADAAFVVVWSSTAQDGDADGVYGQRYDASGEPRGAEFRVNQTTEGDQDYPAVALTASGAFVVAWNSTVPDPANPLQSERSIEARLYDALGDPLTGEIRVTPAQDATTLPALPSVAMATDGRFVIVWQQNGPSRPGDDVLAQRFSATGEPVSDSFLINTQSGDGFGGPVMAMSAAGDFVVAWQWDSQELLDNVIGQRCDAAGNLLGAEFQANIYSATNTWRPAVAMAPGGQFVLAWESHGQDGDSWGIFAQRFSPLGLPLGRGR